MKAWVTRNNRLELEDVSLPARHADEMLVRVRAVSLNRGEIRAVAHSQEGEVPGWDIAGTVEAGASNGAGPREGDRVVALLNRGGWAEFAAVPAAHAALVPDGVELEAAATLPVAALTAVRAFDIAGSLIGKAVLVTGASGGVGQFAIQLGAHAGATVIGISSRAAQHEVLRALGASEVFRTIEETSGPFDLILESVGGSSLAAAVERVARDGVVITIGNSSEQDTTFNARTLYAKGGATMYGLLIFKEAESRRVGAADLTRLLGMLRDGKLRAPIDVRKDWKDLPTVLDDFERRAYAGKAVLTLG